jgi:hypothetical protein
MDIKLLALLSEARVHATCNVCTVCNGDGRVRVDTQGSEEVEPDTRICYDCEPSTKHGYGSGAKRVAIRREWELVCDSLMSLDDGSLLIVERYCKSLIAMAVAS